MLELMGKKSAALYFNKYDLCAGSRTCYNLFRTLNTSEIIFLFTIIVKEGGWFRVRESLPKYILIMVLSRERININVLYRHSSPLTIIIYSYTLLSS